MCFIIYLIGVKCMIAAAFVFYNKMPNLIPISIQHFDHFDIEKKLRIILYKSKSWYCRYIHSTVSTNTKCFVITY